MKNKLVITLTIVLIILISIIIVLGINLKKKTTFVKPEFDNLATTELPKDLDYSKGVLKIMDGYSIYIDATPKIIDNELIINFISMKDNNVWIKVRILNDDNVVGESGLIRAGEYLDKIKLTGKLTSNKDITYMIMGYEIDTYLSAGVVTLKTKEGE